jgi:1,6-anhydro-N-acetylmuramate kinase
MTLIMLPVSGPSTERFTMTAQRRDDMAFIGTGAPAVLAPGAAMRDARFEAGLEGLGETSSRHWPDIPGLGLVGMSPTAERWTMGATSMRLSTHRG